MAKTAVVNRAKALLASRVSGLAFIDTAIIVDFLALVEKLRKVAKRDREQIRKLKYALHHRGKK